MSLNEEVLDIIKAENYLLGILTDEEAFNFECEVFPDENLSEQLDIVRLGLSEKYLADELDRQQKNQFEKHFLSSAYNSEIFAFQKSLSAEIDRRNITIEEENEIVPLTVSEKKKGFRTSLFENFSLKTFAVPAFAALLLIVLGVISLYNSRKSAEIAKTETPTPTPVRQTSPESTPAPTQTPVENTNAFSNRNENINNNQTTKEQNQNNVSQTPAPKKDIPSPSAPVVATIILAGRFRDVGSEEKPVVIGEKTRNINLKFQYPKENSEARYKNYKVVLETISGNKILERNLSKEGRKSGDNLTENVSPGLLQNGRYRFRIVGISQNEKEETVESDTFFVKRIG